MTGQKHTPFSIQRSILDHKKRSILVTCGIVIVALAIFLTLSSRNTISRNPNITAFCKAYHTSKGSGDLSDKVLYLRSLEQYAPNDIYPTIHTMRTTYEQAQKQPSNYMGLELGITGSIQNFNDYTSSHCEQ